MGKGKRKIQEVVKGKRKRVADKVSCPDCSWEGLQFPNTAGDERRCARCGSRRVVIHSTQARFIPVEGGTVIRERRV